MRMKASGVVSGLLLGLALTALSSAAGALPIVVFQDDFDAETGSGNGASGQSKSNYNAFLQWTVSNGTVDLVAHTDFGIDCFGGAGKCVDLDGATNDAGVLTSIALNLAPGTYDFSFRLAGVELAFNPPQSFFPNTVDVSIGTLFVAAITVNKGDPYAEYGGVFEVLVPTTVSIVFANQGGDNFGGVLDAVKLQMVPEPGTAALLALGLAALASRRARAL